MKNSFQRGVLNNLKYDIPASLVVFLVAVPLCLGIALASGAPLFSGIIAGMIGGIVVGSLSGSQLGVSGPAAGLTVIVIGAIQDLGSFPIFLAAVVIGGIIQVLLGYIKAGTISYFFPSSVIKGMLSAIGIIIFLKQIPHAFGYDKDPEGDLEFIQPDGYNTFTEMTHMMDYVSPGAILVSVISLFILILWERPFMKRVKLFEWVQGPLVAVAAGIVLNIALSGNETFAINQEHLVNLPINEGIMGFVGQFTTPDWSALTNPDLYIVGATIAVVASLETLLCVDASDKQDPFKRMTPVNRELKAQGVGNIISGLIGGLPLTQVIVRSSANVQSGGRTKTSTVLHGVLILVSAFAIPGLLNLIPLASLASILFVVGYKLAKPAIFKAMWQLGWKQFVPFIVTVMGIVLTDLLIGIGLGLAIGIGVIIYQNLQSPFHFHKDGYTPGSIIRISLSENVTFMNKASIHKTLYQIPDNSEVVIDGSKTVYIDHDVLELLEEFKITAQQKGINLKIKNLDKTIELNAYKAFEQQVVNPNYKAKTA